MLRRIVGPLAATALVAATGALVAPGGTAAAVPARAAAACSTASGVTAVVDFNELSGGVTAGCDGNGGGPASQNFADAGYQLSYSQAPGMNGFVCKVQGKPTDGDCAQTDQFWSLWWSDGKSGEWVFSSRGASSLTVPEGGYVGFSWHQGGGDAQPPGVVPTAHRAEEPETPESGDGSNDGDGNGNSGGLPGSKGNDSDDVPAAPDDPSTGATTTPSDEPSDDPSDAKTDGKGKPKDRDGKQDGRTGEPSPTDDSSTDLPQISEITDGPPPEAAAEEGSSFPTWIAVGIAVLVIGAAGAVPILRRRAG
jgi:hypothetical protein